MCGGGYVSSETEKMRNNTDEEQNNKKMQQEYFIQKMIYRVSVAFSLCIYDVILSFVFLSF